MESHSKFHGSLNHQEFVSSFCCPIWVINPDESNGTTEGVLTSCLPSGERLHSNGKSPCYENGKIHFRLGHFPLQTVSSPEGTSNKKKHKKILAINISHKTIHHDYHDSWLISHTLPYDHGTYNM